MMTPAELRLAASYEYNQASALVDMFLFTANYATERLARQHNEVAFLLLARARELEDADNRAALLDRGFEDAIAAEMELTADEAYTKEINRNF